MRYKAWLIGLTAALWAVSSIAGAQVEAAPSGRSLVYFKTEAGAKPRIVVTTDPELDDSNSMVRYLLYSNDFDTVGLIYASSQYHWSGDLKGTKFSFPNRERSGENSLGCPCTSYRWPTSQLHIDRAMDAYAKVFANLRVHDPAYPKPEYLRSIIRWGNVEFAGDISHDTAGSDLIRDLLLDDARTPVYLLAWGGENTIARALRSIEERYSSTPQWPNVRAQVVAKAVIVASGHQDDTYATYIQPNWPEIRYLESAEGVPIGYGAQSQVSATDAAYFSAAWMKSNVLGHGPLGAMYRVWGDGMQMVPGDRLDYFGVAGRSAEQLARDGYRVWAPLQETGSYIGEGDSPTFLNFISNGLEGFRDETFGGWAGHRMTIQDRERQTRLIEAFRQDPASAMKRPRRATDPFVAAVQRDFAARLQWSVAPTFGSVNHRPVVTLASVSVLTARPGETVRLTASARDPDGDPVTLRWWRWKAADSYSKDTAIEPAAGAATAFRIPSDAKPGQTFQIIAEAQDTGRPILTGYAKIVIHVER